MIRNSAQDYTKKKGFGVAPSPFNGVKLELGVILSLGILIWFAIHYFIKETDLQLLLLLAFSVSAMLRLVFKSRKILRQIQNPSTDSGNTQKESQH